jgi:S-formylglutathione hydrolase FrmB
MMNKSFPLVAFGAILLLAPSTAQAQPSSAKTVEFDSPSVGRKMKYSIVLPEKYEQSTDRYPVLYLLHGLTSAYTQWPRQGVPLYARAYDLIVVMADGGNSWYLNWAQSDSGQKNNWEDAIMKDLIGHVDGTYRTIAKREGRAINGLSMGGQGALMLGLRHPDMFCSIGSHSGAIHYVRGIADRLRSGQELQALGRRGGPPRVDPNIRIEGFNTQEERTPKGKIFLTADQADAHDPFKLVLKVPREKLPHIYFDCGTEDTLYRYSVEFAKLLMDNKIPFTFAESAGAHDAAYWTREVALSMAAQYGIMQRNLAAARRTTAGGAGGD